MKHKLMIVTGGLGNQMFEYAFLMALRSKGYKVTIDTSYYDYVKMHNGYELERVFGIQESLVNKQGLHLLWLRFLNRFRPKYFYLADDMTFNQAYLDRPANYIWGYWQDERYFKEIELSVRDIFKFQNIDEHNKTIAQTMSKICSVSLHVRRGDYSEFGMNLIGEEYYSKAIEHIRETVGNELFFYIFSDDAEVAKRIADTMGIRYTMVSHNQGGDSYKDMFLMSQCKHNIIANSSFSWWGAWLNSNKEKIVVAPKNWDSQKLHFAPQCKNWIII